MAFCHNCGSQLPDGSAFCGRCGARQGMQPQKRICPNCKNEMAANMIFCDKCGTKYTAPPPSRPYTQPAPQPASHNASTSKSANTGKITGVPIVSTGFKVSFVICLCLCFPVAFYGLACWSRATKAATQEEADKAIRKGTRACVIGIILMLIVWFLLLWGNGVINW